MASSDEPDLYSNPGRYPDISRERDRIAAGLQHDVIRRIFAIGLNLEGAAAIVTDAVVRRRVEEAVDDLDGLVRTIRDIVFDLEDHAQPQRARSAGRTAADLHDD